MSNRVPFLWPLAAALIIASAFQWACARPAQASVPNRLAVTGQLLSGAGNPAPDGTYMVTFRLYGTAADKQAAWSEVVAKLTVAGGRFKHALGSATPLNATLLAKAKIGWLGVAVANEPEAKRVPLHSAPNALRAAVASGLACTGCLSISSLKADGDLNLGKGAIKSSTVAAGSIIAGELQAQTLLGGGAKITGASPPPAAAKPARSPPGSTATARCCARPRVGWATTVRWSRSPAGC